MSSAPLPTLAVQSELSMRFQLARPSFVLDIDVKVPARGITAIFGPSGCGKTSLLRCIAGLEKTARGCLQVGGEVWQDATYCRPVHQRPLGYVFQEASLFPHLTVRDNLRYGWQRTPAAARRVAWDEVLALLGIEALLSRMPADLSGGERQRVALARALLSSPRLLLMDEPLSALDHARKQDVLPYLERLRDELDIPVLYVSHALEEVARLADCVVLMEHGRVLACGPVSETLARLDLPTAGREDAGVVWEAVVGDKPVRDHLLEVQCAAGRLVVPERAARAGQRLRLRVQARDVSVALSRAHDSSICNVLPAVVEAAQADAHPAQVLVRLRVGEAPLLARLTQRSYAQLQLAPGAPVWAQIKAVAVL